MMYITNSFPKSVVGRAVVNDFANKELVNFDKCFALVEMDNGSMINYSGCTGAGSLSKWYRLACQTGTIESVRYDQPEGKIIECAAHDDPTIKDLTWSSCGALTEAEYERFYKGVDESEIHHGGVDLVLMIHFLRYLRDEEQPFFDIYHSVSLSATGILSWYSMLSDSKRFEIPDFKNKEERDKVRNDFRMPFAKRYDDLTLPSRVDGIIKL